MKNQGMVALLPAALLLSSCAGAAVPENASSTTSGPTASYHDDVRASVDAYLTSSDADIDAAGQALCAGLDDGVTVDRAKELLGMNGLTATEASTMIRLSIDEFCPQVAG